MKYNNDQGRQCGELVKQGSSEMAEIERTLECRRLDMSLTDVLRDFFTLLGKSGTEKFFHPHGFDRSNADKICGYSGKDFFGVILDRKSILAYGMLRGWDEGYAVPSLGICVHPAVKRSGMGKLMMQYLHAVAKYRGAGIVRLKVSSENTSAIHLYKGFGYSVISQEGSNFIMHKELS